MADKEAVRVDPVTVIGLGLLLLPLLTMWHEIGGHAAVCVAQGGKLVAIGAFYIDCGGLTGTPKILVSLAGVAMDVVLATAAFLLWRRARSDLGRLALWYVATGKAFVAAGYFLFSGVTAFGDLGVGEGGGLEGLSHPWIWRLVFVAIGGIAYWRIVVAAIAGLTAMLGDSVETGRARKIIAHLFYATLGLVAVLVGVLNPIGFVITLMSAIASSFGGNAGFISIGYAVPHGTGLTGFTVARSWPILVAGIVVAVAFALILGPSMKFG